MNTYTIAPTGNDSATGTDAAPFKTFTKALPKLRPGDTLSVRGGEYRERVDLRGSSLTAGTTEAPITVEAASGERPVIIGTFRLSNASYWYLDGINVTWDSAITDTTLHMCRLYGGAGAVWANSELWGACSFAALLLDGGASAWLIDNCHIHDTAKSNGTNQDHLIYVANATLGTISHSLLHDAPNGRGVKLGCAENGHHAPALVTVVENTIVNTAAGNVSLSYDAHDNTIMRNILVTPGANMPAVNGYQLTGIDNLVMQNVVWDAAAVTLGPPIVDAGDNVAADPMLDSAYRPTNPQIMTPDFGHLRWSTT